MSDTEKATGTTEQPTGTTAPAADGSGSASAGGSEPLSAEALQNRLTELESRLAEERRVKEQLLSEKSTVERLRREAEELAQRAGSTPPTPAASADPFEQQLAALTSEAIQLQAEMQLDPTNTSLRRDAIVLSSQIMQVQAAREQAQEQRKWAAMSRDLADVPEGIRQAVASKVMSGEASSVKAAREAVEGSSASSELAKAKERLAALEAENQKLRGIGPTADVSTSVRPSSGGSGAREVTFADYTRTMNGGGDAARKLLAEVDSGIVTIRH